MVHHERKVDVSIPSCGDPIQLEERTTCGVYDSQLGQVHTLDTRVGRPHVEGLLSSIPLYELVAERGPGFCAHRLVMITERYMCHT